MILRGSRTSSGNRIWKWTAKTSKFRGIATSEPELQPQQTEPSLKGTLDPTEPLSPMSERALVLSLQQPGTPEPMSSCGEQIPSISQTMNTLRAHVEEVEVKFQPPSSPPHLGETAEPSIKSRRGIKFSSLFKCKTVSTSAFLLHGSLLLTPRRKIQACLPPQNQTIRKRPRCRKMQRLRRVSRLWLGSSTKKNKTGQNMERVGLEKLPGIAKTRNRPSAASQVPLERCWPGKHHRQRLIPTVFTIVDASVHGCARCFEANVNYQASPTMQRPRIQLE